MSAKTIIIILVGIIVLVFSAILGLTATRSGASTFSTNGEGAHQPFTGILPAIQIKGDLKGFRAGDGKAVPYYVETILVTVVTTSDRPLVISSDSMEISYSDTRQKVTDLPWSARWIRGNADNDLLNPGELVEVTFQVADLNHPIIESTHFTLEFKPLDREPKIIKYAAPGSLDPVIIFEGL